MEYKRFSDMLNENISLNEEIKFSDAKKLTSIIEKSCRYYVSHPNGNNLSMAISSVANRDNAVIHAFIDFIDYTKKFIEFVKEVNNNKNFPTLYKDDFKETVKQKTGKSFNEYQIMMKEINDGIENLEKILSKAPFDNTYLKLDPYHDIEYLSKN